MKKTLLFVLIVSLMLGAFSLVSAQDEVSGDLEIFSWWTGGGEEAGLNALIARFGEMYPDVNVINSAVAGGSGVNAKAVLVTRMLGGDPPDTFQVHAGEELNALWVAAGRMQPLNDIFEENGWFDQFPAGLIDMISDDMDNVYVVPVNIHRANILWYVPGNLEEWGVTLPETLDEFLDVTCPALQEQGVVPLAIGENWTQSHLWESIALGVLGPEAYSGLWNGETDFYGEESLAVWEAYGRVLDCGNEDMNALSWQDASQMVAEGGAAFNIMGDWAAGYFLVDLALEPNVGFGWAPSFGTDGSFMMLSDSFGLPVGAPNPGAVRAWLSFLGTAEAQDLFNPVKGSLPANTTADIGNTELYNAYFQSAYEDWTTNVIVASQRHGAAVPASFDSGFLDIIAVFQADRDVSAAAANTAVLAIETGVGQ